MDEKQALEIIKLHRRLINKKDPFGKELADALNTVIKTVEKKKVYMNTDCVYSFSDSKIDISNGCIIEVPMEEQLLELAKQIRENGIGCGVELVIRLPSKTTNGDMVKTIFPKCEPYENDDIVDVYGISNCCVTFDSEWWNTPYNWRAIGENDKG